MRNAALRVLPGLILSVATLGPSNANAEACTVMSVWNRQLYGLESTLLLAEGGFEATVPADFIIPAGSPYGIDTIMSFGKGATGFVVRAVDVAGVDSGAVRAAMEASGGRMVVVPFPDFPCDYRDEPIESNLIGRGIPVARWWPTESERVVILGHLRPRSMWVNQLPTFNVYFGASEMPYGPSLITRMEYPFNERKAISISAEILFDFLRAIPIRSTLPCSAFQGMESLSTWELANRTLVKSLPMKALFKTARSNVKGDRGAAKNKKQCPASVPGSLGRTH